MSATVVVQIGSSVDPFCKSLGKSSGVGVKKFLQMIRSSIMLKEGYSPFRVYKIGYWNHFGAISSYWLPMLLKQKCHPARIQRNSQMSIASSWGIQEEKTGVCGLVVSVRSVCLSCERVTARVSSQRTLFIKRYRFHAIPVCFTLAITSKGIVVFKPRLSLVVSQMFNSSWRHDTAWWKCQ